MKQQMQCYERHTQDRYFSFPTLCHAGSSFEELALTFVSFNCVDRSWPRTCRSCVVTIHPVLSSPATSPPRAHHGNRAHDLPHVELHQMTLLPRASHLHIILRNTDSSSKARPCTERIICTFLEIQGKFGGFELLRGNVVSEIATELLDVSSGTSTDTVKKGINLLKPNAYPAKDTSPLGVVHGWEVRACAHLRP